MSSNIDKYNGDLDRLIKRGAELVTDLIKSRGQEDETKKKEAKKAGLDFRYGYERWYSEAAEVVRQILPNRLEDFQAYYKRDKRKEITYESYTIGDFLIGLVLTRGLGEKVFDPTSAAYSKFEQQILILSSCRGRFESSLLDIKRFVQADIFDSEVDSARHLLKSGFIRAAGAVVGVVLEKHLAQLCVNHKVSVTKKNPGIADYNDLLKNSNVYDVVLWRFIQRLDDLRNLCNHHKNRDPKSEEVQELIDGVEKTTKTLF